MKRKLFFVGTFVAVSFAVNAQVKEKAVDSNVTNIEVVDALGLPVPPPPPPPPPPMPKGKHGKIVRKHHGVPPPPPPAPVAPVAEVAAVPPPPPPPPPPFMREL